MLERMVTGQEPGYANTKVVCYVATTPQPDDEDLLAELMEDMDPSCKVSTRLRLTTALPRDFHGVGCHGS